MAKERQHTAHNQTRKWHRNGIHKPRKGRRSTLGMDQVFLRNQRYARAGSIKALKERRAAFVAERTQACKARTLKMKDEFAKQKKLHTEKVARSKAKTAAFFAKQEAEKAASIARHAAIRAEKQKKRTEEFNARRVARAAKLGYTLPPVSKKVAAGKAAELAAPAKPKAAKKNPKATIVRRRRMPFKIPRNVAIMRQNKRRYQAVCRRQKTVQRKLDATHARREHLKRVARHFSKVARTAERKGKPEVAKTAKAELAKAKAAREADKKKAADRKKWVVEKTIKDKEQRAAVKKAKAERRAAKAKKHLELLKQHALAKAKKSIAINDKMQKELARVHKLSVAAKKARAELKAAGKPVPHGHDKNKARIKAKRAAVIAAGGVWKIQHKGPKPDFALLRQKEHEKKVAAKRAAIAKKMANRDARQHRRALHKRPRYHDRLTFGGQKKRAAMRKLRAQKPKTAKKTTTAAPAAEQKKN